MNNFQNVDSDTLQPSPPIKQKARRNKYDQIQRNHICRCGKSYLSYPALYTHIKTKHDIKCITKQGIPQFKNADNKNQEKDDYWLNKPQQQQLCQFLDKLINQFQAHIQTGYDNSQQDQFFVNQIKLYWKKHTKEELLFNNLIYQATIDQAFGLFLTYAQEQMKKKSYSFIEKLIIDMRTGLNQLQSNAQYCKNTDASRLPLCMNDLFIFHLEGTYCLYQYGDKRNLICIMIYHFSRWLQQQRLTNLSLRLNIL